MDNISRIVKKAQDEIFPELEAKIRQELETKDKDWLIDQIIFLTCERHGLQEQKNNLENTKERLTRIRKTGYTHQSLADFIKTYRKVNREDFEKSGFLINAPHQGLACIEPHQRSKQGQALLEKARDILYLALYGDASIAVNLKREQEEILTIILPQSKSDVLFFLKAVTELNASGTWKDPEGVSNDDHTMNIALQIEFGDNTQETIGLAIFVALHLINLLHVNEQIFYARMEKVERSSLEVL